MFNPFCIVTMLVTYVKEQCLFFLRDTVYLPAKLMQNSIFSFRCFKKCLCHFVKTCHFIWHHPAECCLQIKSDITQRKSKYCSFTDIRDNNSNNTKRVENCQTYPYRLYKNNICFLCPMFCVSMYSCRHL